MSLEDELVIESISDGFIIKSCNDKTFSPILSVNNELRFLLFTESEGKFKLDCLQAVLPRTINRMIYNLFFIFHFFS